MKYYKFGTYTGKTNMQIDSDLLEEAIASQSNEAIFRLYAWSPRCISLGRNQKDDFTVGLNEDCVRRLTGGRALLHDNEITYSYIGPVSGIPNGESVTESYKYISGILIDFFKTLGINLDFGENKKISTKFDYCMLISTGADVCYNGKKIIGSAQYRSQGYILQHGSILYDYDKELLENLFKEKVDSSYLTTIKELLPNLSKEDFLKKLEEFIINR